ncbi:hypothetical protein CE91St41_13210 [Oscillospiraceae bacterium]|nr:hypothetical protein CE91St40_24330 [Oscillospiraceae bacterium]BDF74432.1 hypothetical protein CE91St41_13210 [Oscillospiraceae bacterium]
MSTQGVRPRLAWGPAGRGGAYAPYQAFCLRQNLDAGGINSRRADQIKGLPPDLGPVGWSAGTQAEDALTMKRDYQAFVNAGG